MEKDTLRLRAVIMATQTTGVHMSLAEAVELVRSIRDRYVANQEAPEAERIPHVVFERLLELLQVRLEGQVSEELVTALASLPQDSVIVAPLMEHLQERLIQQYSVRLDAVPDDPAALLHRAGHYLESRDWNKAQADLNRLDALGLHSSEVVRLRIRAFIGAGDLPKAYEGLNDLLRDEPDDRWALYMRAQIYIRYHYFDFALSDIDILAASTEAIVYIIFCARQYLLERRLEDAIALCRRALVLEVNNKECMLILAESLFLRGEYEQSSIFFELFLQEVGPDPSLEVDVQARLRALRHMGDIQYHLRDVAGAVEKYIQVMALGERGYDVRRSYVRATYDHLFRSEFVSPLNVPREWVEANMSAEVIEARPRKVIINNIADPPYLERLPWLHFVEDLQILESPIDDAAPFWVLFAQEMPFLKGLKINAERFDYWCVRLLVRAPFFGRLRSLMLSHCDLDAPAMVLIVSAMASDIQELRLMSGNARPRLPVPNGLGDSFLARSPLPALEILELSSCNLGADDVRQILLCDLPQLRHLNLTGNPLAEMKPEELLESPLLEHLEVLIVNDTGLERALVSLLLSYPRQLKLRKVGVHGDWTQAELVAFKNNLTYLQNLEIDWGLPRDVEEEWMKLFEKP